METIELGGRSGREVYEELKHRLEGMGCLPDEYSCWTPTGKMTN